MSELERGRTGKYELADHVEVTPEIKLRASHSTWSIQQFAWLYHHIGIFQGIQETGRPGSTNPAMVAFLNRIYVRFKEKWGWESVSLAEPPVERGGDPVKRREQATKMVWQWFRNQCRKSGPAATVKPAVLNIAHKNPKREKVTLYRLSQQSKEYHDALAAEFKKHQAEMGTKASLWANFREARARKEYQELPEAEKEAWVAQRDSNPKERKAKKKSASAIDVDWSDAEDVGVEEVARRDKMLEMQRKIEQLCASMSKVQDDIQTETGFVSVTLLAGPEPKRGGKLSVFLVSTGETDQEESMAEYHIPVKMQSFMGIFSDFADQCFTPLQREAVSLDITDKQMKSYGVMSLTPPNLTTSDSNGDELPVYVNENKPSVKAQVIVSNMAKEQTSAEDKPRKKKGRKPESKGKERGTGGNELASIGAATTSIPAVSTTGNGVESLNVPSTQPTTNQLGGNTTYPTPAIPTATNIQQAFLSMSHLPQTGSASFNVQQVFLATPTGPHTTGPITNVQQAFAPPVPHTSTAATTNLQQAFGAGGFNPPQTPNSSSNVQQSYLATSNAPVSLPPPAGGNVQQAFIPPGNAPPQLQVGGNVQQAFLGGSHPTPASNIQQAFLSHSGLPPPPPSPDEAGTMQRAPEAVPSPTLPGTLTSPPAPDIPQAAPDTTSSALPNQINPQAPVSVADIPTSVNPDDVTDSADYLWFLETFGGGDLLQAGVQENFGDVVPPPLPGDDGGGLPVTNFDLDWSSWCKETGLDLSPVKSRSASTPYRPALVNVSNAQPTLQPVGLSLIKYTGLVNEPETWLYTDDAPPATSPPPPYLPPPEVVRPEFTIADSAIPEADPNHNIIDISRTLLELLGEARGFLVVDKWRRLESLFGFPGSRGKTKRYCLGAANRPQAITAWMSKRSGRPTISDAELYLEELLRYYRLLQPKHRACVLDFPLPKSKPLHSDEWEPLLKGGRNGIIVLLFGIAWLPGLGVSESKVTAIVDDVDWVLGELVAAASTMDLGCPPSIPKKRRASADLQVELNHSERVRRPTPKVFVHLRIKLRVFAQFE